MSKIRQSGRDCKVIVGWKVFLLPGNICSYGMGQTNSICFIDAKKDKQMNEIPQSSRYWQAVVGWKVFPLVE